MQSTLLVSEFPTRRIVILPKSSNQKQTQHCLTLEKIKSSVDRLQCTAKFQSAQALDHGAFNPLLQTPVYGVLGLVQVDNEPFVCVITDCAPVGKIEGNSIYCINNVMFFSLTQDKYDNVSDNGASYQVQKELPQSQQVNLDGTIQEQVEILKHPCAAMQKFISSSTFYFSYDFDLTRCAQTRYQQPSDQSIWDVADDRFFWNSHIIGEILKFRKQLADSEQASLDREGLLVMCINGFVRIDDVNMYGEKIKCAVISRLSCKRSGTRFNTRGIDDDGNVANNAETELLMYVKDYCYSNVSVRGSVPLFWEQQGVQLGGHKIQLIRSKEATQPAFERHFKDMVDHYGQQHVVNLLGQKEGSAEAILSREFVGQLRLLEVDPPLRQTHFDFHAETKGAQFENVASLQYAVINSVKDFGYFLVKIQPNTEIIMLQQGTFRINCLDCLDRTNVVQGYICKLVLNQFAQSQQMLKVSADTLFSQFLNDLFADNGDELSRIYTGTGALKSGFTRTGKRSIFGMMDDAKKSAVRLYNSNFQDKSKQEIIDQLLGKLPNQAKITLHNPLNEAITQQLESRQSEWSSKTKINVHFATWNVNGKPPSSESLTPWLTFGKQIPDVIVVGFQEIVELSPQQIMATDINKRLVWEDLLLKTVNAGSQRYIQLKSDQLVGAAMCIFVRAEQVSFIRNVSGATKKTGLAGLAGNKGGVGVRFDFYDTSLCFVCAHLAAGHSNYSDRNADYGTINDGMLFSKGSKIMDNENVFWLGDFNYPEDINVFECCISRISEGKINFAPTYRYDVGTSNYDSSEKARIPAWTDRILFSGTGIRQLAYDRAELTSSDHKPVKASFEVDLRIVNKEVRDRILGEIQKKLTGQKLTPPGSNGQINNQSSKIASLIDFDDGSFVPALPARPIAAPNSQADWLTPRQLQDPFADPVPEPSKKRPPIPPRQANPFADPFNM